MDVERREIGNGYVNVGHGTKVILSVSSLSLSGGQELTITTDVFSFPCYQFPFVFTHINKWIQKHTTPFFPHIISALWTSVDISNKICFTVSVELKYSHKASLCPHYGVRTVGTMDNGHDHGTTQWPESASHETTLTQTMQCGSQSLSSGEYYIVPTLSSSRALIHWN